MQKYFEMSFFWNIFVSKLFNMAERELWFTDEWLPKVIERGIIILDSINQKKDISEGDYEILEGLHYLWFYGWYGWKKEDTKPEKQPNVTQGGLFDDKTAELLMSFDDERDKLLNGKKVVVPEELTKKE